MKLDERSLMRVALRWAAMSKCERLQVGCVLASSRGYVASRNTQPRTGCTGTVGACGCVHAESNAINSAQLLGLVADRAIVTHQPCEACARLLIELGTVRMVRWLNPYRLTTGAELLVSAGIDAKEWRL